MLGMIQSPNSSHNSIQLNSATSCVPLASRNSRLPRAADVARSHHVMISTYATATMNARTLVFTVFTLNGKKKTSHILLILIEKEKKEEYEPGINGDEAKEKGKERKGAASSIGGAA